jgi:hypothetical protein
MLEFIAGQARNMESWKSRLLCGFEEEKKAIIFNLCDFTLCNFSSEITISLIDEQLYGIFWLPSSPLPKVKLIIA